jgi:hypothetical protein
MHKKELRERLLAARTPKEVLDAIAAEEMRLLEL